MSKYYNAYQSEVAMLGGSVSTICDNQEMDIAMNSPGKTIYYMKKKTIRAQKVRMFSLHFISTGRCGD